MQTICFICKVIEPYQDNIARVIVNKDDIKNFPTPDIKSERLVEFHNSGEVLELLNVYIAVWSASIEGNKVTVNDYTIIGPPSYSVAVDMNVDENIGDIIDETKWPSDVL